MITQGLKNLFLLSQYSSSRCCPADIDSRASAVAQVTITRLLDRPLIGPDIHPSIGENIQGPSLIKVRTGYPTKWATTISTSRTIKDSTYDSPTLIQSPAPGRSMNPGACRSRIPILRLHDRLDLGGEAERTGCSETRCRSAGIPRSGQGTHRTTYCLTRCSC